MNRKKYCLVCNIDLIGRNYKSIYDDNGQEKIGKSKAPKSKKVDPDLSPVNLGEKEGDNIEPPVKKLAVEQGPDQSVNDGAGRRDVGPARGESTEPAGQLQHSLDEQLTLHSKHSGQASQDPALPGQPAVLQGVHASLPSAHSHLPSHQAPLSAQPEALPSHQAQMTRHHDLLQSHQLQQASQQDTHTLSNHQSQLPSQQDALPGHQIQLPSQQEAMPIHQLQLSSQREAMQSHQTQLPRSQEAMQSHQSQLSSQQETLPSHQTQLPFHQGLPPHTQTQYTSHHLTQPSHQAQPQTVPHNLHDAPSMHQVRQPSHEEVQLSQDIQQQDAHQPHQELPSSHQINLQQSLHSAQTSYPEAPSGHQGGQSVHQNVQSPHEIVIQPSLQAPRSGPPVSGDQGLQQAAHQQAELLHQVSQAGHQDVRAGQPAPPHLTPTSDTHPHHHRALLDQQAASGGYQSPVSSHPVTRPGHLQEYLPPAYQQSKAAHTSSAAHVQLVHSHTNVVSAGAGTALTQGSVPVSAPLSAPSTAPQLGVAVCAPQVQVAVSGPAPTAVSLEHSAALTQAFSSMSNTGVTQSMVDSYMNVTALGQASDRSYMPAVSAPSTLHPHREVPYTEFADAHTWTQAIPVSTSLPLDQAPAVFGLPTSQGGVLLTASTPQMALPGGQHLMHDYTASSHHDPLPPQPPMDVAPSPAPYPYPAGPGDQQTPPAPEQEAKDEEVKLEKDGEEAGTDTKKEDVKTETTKGPQLADPPGEKGDKPVCDVLKERLESALQLSLSGKVCHSTYVCDQCEGKLDEIELYYKVVTEFRQSFFDTAHQHGIEDHDIAEGISLSSGQPNQKSLLERFLAQSAGKGGAPGGVEGDSTWQQLINPRFLESALSDSTAWLRALRQQEPKEEEEQAPPPPQPRRGRGRPRKSQLAQKAAPVKKAAPPPPRLKLPHREAKVKQEPKRRGRKPRQAVDPTPVPVGDDDDDDTVEDVVDDETDDEWKPDNPKQTVPAAKPLVVKQEEKTEKVEEGEEDRKAADLGTPQEASSLPPPRRLRKKMYMCVVCKKSFSGVTVLKFHVQKKHKGRKLEEPYRCVTCSESFESPTGLRLHVKMHLQEENRNCELCGKAYGSVAALNLHIRNKHPHMRKRTGKFTCTTCNKRFSCIQSLQMHTRNQHDAEREIHTCSVCSRSFLDKERKLNHEAKCEIDMEKLNLVRNLESDRSFVCKICGASYKNKSAFKQHHYTHKDEKPHQCRLCESKFLYKKSLTDHIAAVHHGERRMKAFKCEVCGHGYSHAGDLAKHMTLHSGKFCCPTCNKACAGSYKLKEHMRIHTGEKPYKCEVCGAAFTQAAGLKSHQYTHKANKRFLCTICGMQFAHRTTFRRHGMTHTGERPYKCTICNKGFQFDWVLKDHIKTHTGEKPHLCAICGKSFTQPQHLKTHYRIHTGEKPYRCVHCDVSYRHLSSYNQHKRNCPVTGGQGDKKDPRPPKVRKLGPPPGVVPPTLQPPATTSQMSTLPSADLLAHLSRPSTYLQQDEGLSVLADQTQLRLPSHHALLGPPPPGLSGPHLAPRVTLAEAGGGLQGGVQGGQGAHSALHQAGGGGRHLLQLGALSPQDLTPMQHAVIPASQPMDMTSSSAMAMGAGQGQHDQTVQAFSTMLPAGYTQNYVH